MTDTPLSEKDRKQIAYMFAYSIEQPVLPRDLEHALQLERFCQAGFMNPVEQEAARQPAYALEPTMETAYVWTEAGKYAAMWLCMARVGASHVPAPLRPDVVVHGTVTGRVHGYRADAIVEDSLADADFSEIERRVLAYSVEKKDLPVTQVVSGKVVNKIETWDLTGNFPIPMDFGKSPFFTSDGVFRKPSIEEVSAWAEENNSRLVDRQSDETGFEQYRFERMGDTEN